MVRTTFKDKLQDRRINEKSIHNRNDRKDWNPESHKEKEEYERRTLNNIRCQFEYK